MKAALPRHDGPEVFACLWAYVGKELNLDAADVLPANLDVEKHDGVLRRFVLFPRPLHRRLLAPSLSH
jgi:hypothetical protein